MLKHILRGMFLLTILFNFVNAQEHNSKDIIDVVDYKIDRIKSGLGNELHKVKSELEELKKIKSDETVTKKIMDIEESVKNLENKIDQISRNSLDSKSIEKRFAKYDTLIVNSNSAIKIWSIGSFLTILVFVYFMMQTIVKKAKEQITLKTEEMLKKNMQDYRDELNVKEMVNIDTKALINKIETKMVHSLNGDKNIQLIKNKFDLLRTQYIDSEIKETVLLDELKNWAKTIEEKKTRKKVTNFLDELTRNR